MKELAEFKQRFDGIDPEEVRRLAQEKSRLEEEQKLKAGEFDKVLESRTAALRTEHGKAMQSFQGCGSAPTLSSALCSTTLS